MADHRNMEPAVTSSDAEPIRVDCRTWDDFIRAIRISSHQPLARVGRLYRGQPSPDLKLASMEERTLAANHVQFTEPGQFERSREFRKDRLVEFRERAIGLPGVRPSSFPDDLSWWALGRHYGLVTPLLDWTRSPYVAAFFAVTSYIRDRNAGLAAWGYVPMSRLEGSIVVWELAEPDQLTVPGELELCLDRSVDAARQKAQQGVFSVLTHEQYFDIGSYLTARGRAHHLACYVLPAQWVFIALNDLALMNVTFATLFPDVEGAALQANMSAYLNLSRELAHLSADWSDVVPNP
jgi:hypothetical protein